MFGHLTRWFACSAMVLLPGCERAAAPPAPVRPSAPLYEGMGRSTMTVQATPVAQRYFEQGLQLAFGFDFVEAERSFAASLQLDPTCALCAWGLAYVTGPNINRPEREPPSRLAAARKHLQLARRLAVHAPARERALVDALALRLEASPAAAVATDVKAAPPASACTPSLAVEAQPADRAYAEAMQRVARSYPDDVDIAVLYAEALLMLSPWDWWRDGVLLESTQRAIKVLDEVLARQPDHVGANHFLIHAFEQSPEPERALGSAARLPQLAPAIGHLVHMPAHIYVRLGRYADASRANQAAIEADASLAQQAIEQGFDAPAPVTHHLHFLWATRSMEGQDMGALDAAGQLARIATRLPPGDAASGDREYFLALPYFAHVRFARWGELLAMPMPDDRSPYVQAVWHWARGMAQVRQGRPQKGFDELAELETRIGDPSLEGKRFKGIDELREFLEIAAASLRCEAQLAQKNPEAAIESLAHAAELEDALESEEPPPWAYSTRVALGSAQLIANRPRDAEASFRQDLKRYPNNGWALYGLAEALRRQNRRAEALRAQADFRAAWPGGDLLRPDARY